MYIKSYKCVKSSDIFFEALKSKVQLYSNTGIRSATRYTGAANFIDNKNADLFLCLLD